MFRRSFRQVFSIAALSCIPLLATAAPSPADLPVNPSTGGDQILQYYPAGAAAAGTDGTAVVKCGRTQNGGFENCKVVSESPQNSGFAAAALAITAHAAAGCVTLSKQQRAPKDWTFNFTASPLSITPDVVKPGWMIQGPSWLRRPSADDFQSAYPRGTHGAGQATLVCKVSNTGALVDCSARDESPVGQGFGAAAIQLARDFKMTTETCDGKPVEGGTIITRIRWDAR